MLNVEDKVCNGFLNNEQLLLCSKYKVELCIMIPECYKVCNDLECWRGEDTQPFFNIVVPKNITSDTAKNLCTFYNSKYFSTLMGIGVDPKQCRNCQIYTDVLRFESFVATLQPYQKFILSVILVFVVFIVIIISYYNIVLAVRGKPPFSVCKCFP